MQEMTPQQALSALDSIVQTLNFPRSTHIELIHAVAILQRLIDEKAAQPPAPKTEMKRKLESLAK